MEAIPAARPALPPLRAVLVLAALGAALGPLLDYAHVATGAIRYTESVRFVPVWVPFLYTGAALSIGLAHPLSDRLFGRPDRIPLTPSRVAAGFAAFCAIWFASGAIHLGSGVVTVILAPASVAMWWWLDRTRRGLWMALLAALGGSATEIVLSRAGLFSHTHQDVLGLAYWLPWLYVAASVGIGNVGRWLWEAERR